MLIPLNYLVKILNLKIRGILHVGAHECEEKEIYNREGVSDENIIWIDALQDKVDICKKKHPNINIYQALISDIDDEKVNFYVTNNTQQKDNAQSSSILEFGTHKINHPHIILEKTITLTTSRLDSFIKKNNISMLDINMICLDIQGVELRALKSLSNYLNNIDYIYTEVNTEDVYNGCDKKEDIDAFLLREGFVLVINKMWGNCGWGDAFYIRR